MQKQKQQLYKTSTKSYKHRFTCRWCGPSGWSWCSRSRTLFFSQHNAAYTCVKYISTKTDKCSTTLLIATYISNPQQ